MNSRWVAARVITKVVEEGQSLTVALDNALKSIDSLQDKAFIQAMCYGVCRSYQRLEFILELLLDKPIKVAEIKSLILVGLFQLNAMRVKPHAAVSETVQATKQMPWARGLVNAVLRNYLRKQTELELKADQNSTAAVNHPTWLIEQLEKDWPQQVAALLAENNQQPPMVLRVNSSKISREAYLKQLDDQSISASLIPHCASGILVDKPVVIEALPDFSKGVVSVQDSAAQLAPELLQLTSELNVLDVCAAPGGKTAHILEYKAGMKVTALDIDANRMQRVKLNLQRLDLQADLVTGDATKPETWWNGVLFERILLDAPCSATGVIRRHPDIKLLRRKDDITALVALQKQILQAIWPLLTKGGLLLYATCSVFKQENEAQIAEFLACHQDAKEVPIAAEWGSPRPVGRQILTGQHGMDGFYYACITKL